MTIYLTIITWLKEIRDKYFKRSLSKNRLKTITELTLRVEKYINFKESFHIVDDLDLSDLEVAIRAKENSTLNSIHLKSSIKKRSTDQGRDAHKT